MIEPDHWKKSFIQRMEKAPIYALLGIALLDAAPGSVTLELHCDERHTNVDGALHGGILSLLADTAMGFAVRSQIDPAWQNKTLNLTIDWMGGARVGDRVVTVAVVAHATPRFRWASASMALADGAVIAHARSLNAVRPPRTDAQREANLGRAEGGRSAPAEMDS